ncbi:MAG: cell division protein FtsZ [Chloroflexi bacterium]|nr:MAG: cell division protein FtsZ [Chloroflexota bacterium]
MQKKTFVPTPCKIKAIGVGGAGCNAINRMVRAEIQGIEFVAINTDTQALMLNQAQMRIQIGERSAQGLGVGGNPSKGRQAAEENLDEIRQAFGDARMVFIAAGMGGGTGTGASPLVARLARESGALTIAIVTKPFNFEMGHRTQIAEQGIDELEKEVDAMIVIPNDRLLSTIGDKMTVDNAFKTADDVLMVAVRAISEVITVPGMINLDFADVSAIMKGAGPCWLSIGHGSGQNRVVDAARSAISSQLLEVPISGAKGMLYIISGPSNLTLSEVNQAANVIRAEVDQEAMVIFGVNVDPKLRDDVTITMVATGFTPVKAKEAQQRDEEFRVLIRELESDETRLETPAFMRRPTNMRLLSTSMMK